MRKNSNEPRPGQIGKYWLSRKPGRTGPNDHYCRTWYDERKRQTCHVSLGTANIHDASCKLHEWFALNERPKNARPETILIDSVLLHYWEEHGKMCASARTIQRELAVWQEWWSGLTVADITSEKQREFREHLGRNGAAHSTIDKILSAGRAALKHAERHGRLQSVPHIFYIETGAEKEARPKLGRPLDINEMACFIDSIRQPHLLAFTMILLNTMARSSAILELRRAQYDSVLKTVALNPDGRIQTSKRRPTLPVAPNLQPWLDQPLEPQDHYVTYKGKPIAAIKNAWRQALALSGLRGKVNRYSFRHGMARQLRLRGIHLDEIGSTLGHKHKAANATTAIYVPDDPAYLSEVAKTIEQIVSEIKQRLTKVNIENPSDALEALARLPRKSFDPLPKPRQAELIALMRGGGRPQDLARKFGISLSSIYQRQKRMGLR